MRRLLHYLAFGLCLAGTAAAAAKVVHSELLAPETFGRPELEAWLKSMPTLSQRSPEERIAERLAARQLARDFHLGFDWQPVFDPLPPAEQEQFAANFRRLLLVLAEQRADAYAALPPHHRERFLDNELGDLAKWYLVAPGGRQFGLTLFQKNWSWSNPALPRDGIPSKIRNFASTLESHWLKRSVGRLLPFGNEKRPRDD